MCFELFTWKIIKKSSQKKEALKREKEAKQKKAKHQSFQTEIFDEILKSVRKDKAQQRVLEEELVVKSIAILKAEVDE